MTDQNKLIDSLSAKYSKDIKYTAADNYYWSPGENTVYFKQGDFGVVGLWTLLHETSHGLLGHKNYSSDFELVRLELEAWQKAQELSEELEIKISDDHMQDCLDSYRDWQYKRSLCPKCELGGVQISGSTYRCIFCLESWQVSRERFL